jgi:hypothetical protein
MAQCERFSDLLSERCGQPTSKLCRKQKISGRETSGSLIFCKKCNWPPLPNLATQKKKTRGVMPWVFCHSSMKGMANRILQVLQETRGAMPRDFLFLSKKHGQLHSHTYVANKITKKGNLELFRSRFSFLFEKASKRKEKNLYLLHGQRWKLTSLLWGAWIGEHSSLTCTRLKFIPFKTFKSLFTTQNNN